MKDAAYWERVRLRATELGSDGCTAVTEFRKDCCFEHDIAYMTGADVNGIPVTRDHADAEFRRCMQSRSIFKAFSPVSWIRWFGVRVARPWVNYGPKVQA